MASAYNNYNIGLSNFLHYSNKKFQRVNLYVNSINENVKINCKASKEKKGKGSTQGYELDKYNYYHANPDKLKNIHPRSEKLFSQQNYIHTNSNNTEKLISSWLISPSHNNFFLNPIINQKVDEGTITESRNKKVLLVNKIKPQTFEIKYNISKKAKKIKVKKNLNPRQIFEKLHNFNSNKCQQNLRSDLKNNVYSCSKVPLFKNILLQKFTNNKLQRFPLNSVVNFPSSVSDSRKIPIKSKKYNDRNTPQIMISNNELTNSYVSNVNTKNYNSTIEDNLNENNSNILLHPQIMVIKKKIKKSNEVKNSFLLRNFQTYNTIHCAKDQPIFQMENCSDHVLKNINLNNSSKMKNRKNLNNYELTNFPNSKKFNKLPYCLNFSNSVIEKTKGSKRKEENNFNNKICNYLTNYSDLSQIKNNTSNFKEIINSDVSESKTNIVFENFAEWNEILTEELLEKKNTINKIYINLFQIIYEKFQKVL